MLDFTAHDDTDIAMLPRKQTRLNEEENRDTEVCIRLPQPANGELMYTPPEAAGILHDLVTPVPRPSRAYIYKFKQTIIDNKRVPDKRTRLNTLLKDHGGPGKPYASPYWNTKGRKEIMLLDDLVAKYHEHVKRIAKGWYLKDATSVPMKILKADYVQKNLDSAKIKDPAISTVTNYHSALMTLVGVTQRMCAAETSYREAEETSQRSMQANAAGVICARAMIVPSSETLPL